MTIYFPSLNVCGNGGDFSGDTAAAFGVGLKLFIEVMLEDRRHPLFASIAPHFRAFMTELKKGAR